MPTGSFQQMVIGFTLMVTAALTGVIMAWYPGQVLDAFYNNQYMPQSLIDNILASPAGAAVYNGMSGLPVTVYYVNLYYGLDFFLGILGVLLFYQGYVKYQSAEGYGIAIAGGSGQSGGRSNMRRRRNR
jgi:hypothetical protein